MKQMGFFKNSNLPDRAVGQVIIGEDYVSELGGALMSLGIGVIACPNNERVDPRLRSHVDLSALHMGGNRLVVSEAVATGGFISALSGLGAEITLSKAPFGCKYPEDAGLCAAVIGERIFHNKSLSVLPNEPRLIDVKQGYAKCTVCIVNENAAVTSDRGMARAMAAAGLDVLTVRDGYISLEGYDKGFIGGASFKIAPDLLALTGTLDGHPDRTQIELFLLSHGVKPVYLTGKRIFDIGSAVPIML